MLYSSKRKGSASRVMLSVWAKLNAKQRRKAKSIILYYIFWSLIFHSQTKVWTGVLTFRPKMAFSGLFCKRPFQAETFDTSVQTFDLLWSKTDQNILFLLFDFGFSMYFLKDKPIIMKTGSTILISMLQNYILTNILSKYGAIIQHYTTNFTISCNIINGSDF